MFLLPGIARRPTHNTATHNTATHNTKPTECSLVSAQAAEEVGTFEVVQVSDGDTVVVIGRTGLSTDRRERVRMALVDTPEIGECGFEQATSVTRSWLSAHGNRFVLRRPVDAPQRDPFDRLLGEVLGPANQHRRRPSLNVALVTGGMARINQVYGAEDPDLLARLRAARDCRNHATVSWTGGRTGPTPW